MNILFFYSHPFQASNGGIERVTNILTKSLVSKYSIKVYYLCGKIDNLSDIQFDSPATEQYSLPYNGLFYNKGNIEFFIKLLDKNNIDIVINQGGMWSYANSILGLGKAKYISVIHSKPTCELVEEKSNYLTYIPEKQSKLRYAIKILMYPFYGIFLQHIKYKQIYNHYKYIIMKSDKIIVLSKKYQEQLQKFVNDENDKIKYINNPNTFSSKDVDFAKKEKTILYVGRLEPILKQPLILLKIWKKLYKKFPDWKVVFVGEGEGRKEMEKYVNKYKIERVLFEGAKNDVIEYYEKASIISLVSKCEGWAMALTEGMVLGCVPICFKSYEAVYDIIDDEKNGFLVTPYNIREYASKLQLIMGDKDKLINMAKCAQKKAQYFTQERIIKKWYNLFSDMLNI